jgi:hypothetical protein
MKIGSYNFACKDRLVIVSCLKTLKDWFVPDYFDEENILPSTVRLIILSWKCKMIIIVSNPQW